MPQRKNISTGTPWETAYGYSRAVRVGGHVHVSGTTASDEQGAVHGIGDAYAQTKYIIEKIERALADAGASLNDVVRTRTFITDIATWEGVARAHAEFFGDIRPASTLVQVSALVSPEQLVEMEVDAYVGGGS